MKIALVTDEYPPARVAGGIGTASRTLAQVLCAGGHDVHVFCQDDGIAKPSNGEVIHPVKAYEPPLRALRYVYFRSLARLLTPIERRARWGFSVARRIVETQRRGGRKFDVIEIPEAGGYAGLVRAAGVNSPLLIRLHGGTAMLCRYSGRKVGYEVRRLTRLERWSVGFADLLAAPSRAILRETASDLGIGRRTPQVIYPYFLPRTSMLSGNEVGERDTRTLLAVGRICRLKGADLVLEAFARLREEFRDLRLVMVGRDAAADGGIRKLLKQVADDGTVTCTGELDSVGVRRWLGRAGIVIVASRFENFPNVVLEALGSGCLVIASDAGGIPEIVTDRQTGLLFRSGCAEDLADKIRYALRHPAECEVIREAGRAWVRTNLADERVLDSVLNAYRLTGEQASRRFSRRFDGGGGERLGSARVT